MGLDWGLLIPVGIVILLCAGFALVVVVSKNKQDPKEGKYEHPTALQKNSSKKSPRRREWEQNKEKEAEGGE